ncbi:MAG TPA: efflux RND transporter permease subunit [Rhodanobacteraceae bacterium]|nr:efflux RND transporter permease subunit [Rhodanobacteraceae bacterium]
MNLAELSLKRPVTAVMFFVTLVVIGLIAAFRLPLESFPALDVPFLLVDIPYVGSTPSEIERTIARPVEDALAALPGIQKMNSTSRADGTQIFLQFKWGENVAVKAVQAREKIDAIRADLPSDLQRYTVQKFSTSDQPILQLRIASERNLANSYALLDRELKRPIERIPGVARVDIGGVQAPELQIELSAQRLAAHGVSLNQLYQRLKQANFSLSAGEVSDAGKRWRVQPQGQWRDLDEIRALPVNAQGLKLGDIAQVTLRPQRVDFARALDGRPAVAVDIYKERNANLVQVGTAVTRYVDGIRDDPQMRGIRVYALQDSAKGVTSSLRELAEAGGIGVLLSVLVLYFFLRDWPSTLMVSLAIPVCLVITLGCMYFFGISLNILSMMGLLLAVGMLVDNAVVVVESIYQYREKYPDKPWYCAVAGTQAVGVAIAAGTLTSVIVFLPNVFGEKNDISIFLTQVAITMAIAHIASWLVAVSVVPMLSSKLPAPKFLNRRTLISRLRDRYARVVAWTLIHRRWSVAGIFALLVLSFWPMTHTKFDMFASSESRELHLTWHLNGQYRLAEQAPAVKKIDDWLLAHKKELEIKSVYTYYSEEQSGNTNVVLVDAGEAKRSSAEITEAIRKGLPKIAIGTVDFDQQRNGNAAPVEVSLRGDSTAQLEQLSDTLIPVLARLPSLRDVHASERGGDREVAVHVDRVRAKQYGFDAQAVGDYLAVALRGMPLSEYRQGDREVPVWLRFRNADAQSLDDLSDYQLRRDDGTQIPLLSMVRIDTHPIATAIERTNRQTTVTIQANLATGKTIEDARKEITTAMSAVTLPAGYHWAFGDSFDDAQNAGNQMMFNMLIALVLVYVVMCCMFESLIFPAAILTTFVFSVLGVFWLFWISGTTFSIMAAIGILILMGVVVSNGIVMIVHINTLRHQGMLRTQALIAGARERLRPILMTMGTAILGMLPLCLTDAQIGGDGPPYSPMARAIAGGLLFSTIVTLLALPVIYALLDDARMAVRRVMRDAKAGRVRSPRAAIGQLPALGAALFTDATE